MVMIQSMIVNHQANIYDYIANFNYKLQIYILKMEFTQSNYKNKFDVKFEVIVYTIHLVGDRKCDLTWKNV